MFRVLTDDNYRTGIWLRLRASTGFQILLILLFWQWGQLLVWGLHLPVPGSVIALATLLLLFGAKIIEPRALQRGARWFLAELMLFLLPSVLSLSVHPEFFGRLGLKLLAAIVTGIAVVMMVTALVVEAGYRFLTVSQRTES